MKQKKIGFIGLGLIGGSIAKAIRRYYPDYEIVAFDKNRELWHLPHKNPSSMWPVPQSMIISEAATTSSYVPRSLSILHI